MNPKVKCTGQWTSIKIEAQKLKCIIIILKHKVYVYVSHSYVTFNKETFFLCDKKTFTKLKKSLDTNKT